MAAKCMAPARIRTGPQLRTISTAREDSLTETVYTARIDSQTGSLLDQKGKWQTLNHRSTMADFNSFRSEPPLSGGYMRSNASTTCSDLSPVVSDDEDSDSDVDDLSP